MQPDRPTVADVLGKLEALGDAEHIAVFFEEQGIQGRPCNSGWCPVAVHLRQETGIFNVAVGEVMAVTYRSAGSPDDPEDLPANVREFIEYFDAEEYPHLIHRGPEVAG